MFELNYVYFRRLYQRLWKANWRGDNQDYAFSKYIKSFVIDDSTEYDYLKADVLESICNYTEAEELFDLFRNKKNKMYRLLSAYTTVDSDIVDTPVALLYRAIDHLIDYYEDNKYDFYNMRECDCCGNMCDSHNTFTAYNGDEVIGDCCQDRYIWCDNADTYLHEDDHDAWASYEEESDQDYDTQFEYVYRYDVNVLDYLSFKKHNDQKTVRYSGIEIEMEAKSSCPDDLPTQICNVFGHHEYCMFKGDGSLSHGFEMVTAPCTLEYHREQIDKLFDSQVLQDDEGVSYVKGWHTDTAGMHIHLDRRMLTPIQLGKLLVFINNDWNRPFIEKIAGRSETFKEDSNTTSYAVMREKKITDGGQRNYNKYEAVNVAHSNTIELRIFRSNLTKDGILRALEFSYALVDFLKQNTMRELDQHYKEFLKWFNTAENRSSYPYFYGWLVRKRYLSGVASRKVTQQIDQAIENVVNG